LDQQVYKFNIMANQTYNDLEYERIKEKHDSLRMEVIEMLVKKFSNDSELGEEVRKFVNLKEKTKE
jgi:hypothetical protein